jgi:hypothetical protein
MTDEEQAAWDEDGIGQPPSHDPAGAITKGFIIIGSLIAAGLVISSIAQAIHG